MRALSCGQLMDPEHGRALLKTSFLTVLVTVFEWLYISLESVEGKM
jgi:hypothetical protein